MATTYNNLYLDARKALLADGVAAAQIEARELVCFAADKTRVELLRDMPLYASDGAEARLRELLRRRLAGEPVAYLIGEWEFCGVELDISPDVLVPRDDTEVLAQRAIQLAKAIPGECRALDLCAGSGCVGLAIARYADNARVILAELSESALRVCRQNIRRNKLGDRVSALQADAKLPPPGALWDFDVIACNPPYIPTTECETLDVTVKNFEPRMALDGGADGLDFYRAIAKNWKSALRLGGTLLFEVGYGQAGDVELILAQNGYENIKTYQDTGEIWRVVEATANT